VVVIVVPDVDGSWASWTPWTPCSAPCDGGTQHRRRTCTSPAPSGAGQECPGSSMDYRTCNVQRCVSQWTCWSEFTPCSVSCRSPMKSSTSWRIGFRTRRRDCDRPEGSATSPCVGESQQTIGCEDLLPLCATGNWQASVLFTFSNSSYWLITTINYLPIHIQVSRYLQQLSFKSPLKV